MKSASPIRNETVEQRLADLYMRRDVIANLIRSLEDYRRCCRPEVEAGPPPSRPQLTRKRAS
jgi:hypothetical protein